MARLLFGLGVIAAAVVLAIGAFQGDWLDRIQNQISSTGTLAGQADGSASGTAAESDGTQDDDTDDDSDGASADDDPTTDGDAADDADDTSDADGSDTVDGSEGDDSAADADDEDADENTDGGTLLVPQQEYSIPMVDPLQRSDATGVADITLDAAAEEVCWTVETSGVGAPYDGHIHVGPSGVKGGIVVDFGPVENGRTGCTDVARTDIEAIVTRPAGHYVEMHDPDGDFTIRAQLSGEPIAPPPDGDVEFDPDGDGAVTVISAGQIVLEGAVPDQETMDRLIFEVSGLDESRILVINDLTIDETADPPTGLITVGDNIQFEVDSATIDGSTTVIEDLALLFESRPEWTMTIIGHTDATGDEVSNLELSLARATAVRDALVELGLDPSRLRTRGAGDTSPIAPNDTDEGRRQNRRIEFELDRN
ncbi:MAG: OmpA family protein [Actinomycetota bacterium]